MHSEEDANSGKWSTVPDGLNAYRVDQKALHINRSVEGVRVFRLDDTTVEDYINPMAQCIHWYEVCTHLHWYSMPCSQSCI